MLRRAFLTSTKDFSPFPFKSFRSVELIVLFVNQDLKWIIFRTVNIIYTSDFVVYLKYNSYGYCFYLNIMWRIWKEVNKLIIVIRKSLKFWTPYSLGFLMPINYILRFIFLVMFLKLNYILKWPKFLDMN